MAGQKNRVDSYTSSTYTPKKISETIYEGRLSKTIVCSHDYTLSMDYHIGSQYWQAHVLVIFK